MQHYAAFHLGLHCLPKYPFRGFQYTKVSSIQRVNIVSVLKKIWFDILNDSQKEESDILNSLKMMKGVTNSIPSLLSYRFISFSTGLKKENSCLYPINFITMMLEHLQ